MPKYAPFGQAIFAETVFGAPPTDTFFTQLSVQPPLSAALLYSGLQINWVPINNPSVVTEQVLVRSAFGVPVSEADGTVLLDETLATSSFSTQYIDTGLKSGHFYYYALFVFDNTLGEYLFAAAAQGLVLTQWEFGDQYLSWLPDFYSLMDSYFGTNAQPAGPLERFLGLLGCEMDWMRSEIESIFMLTDADLISGALLPWLGGNYGMNYEPALGMTRSRFLIKNAVHYYKERGTLPGISAAASGYSGYSCVATIGTNLEIQLDDAAFDLSSGHWIQGNAQSTITHSAPPTGVVPVHLSYLPVSGFPTASSFCTINGLLGYLPLNNVNVGVMKSSGAVLYLTECTPATAVNLGIPVPPLDQQATPQLPPIVFSYYVQPVQQTTPVLKSFVAQIDWYAVNGALISSSVGLPVAELVDTWVRPYVAAQPPPGAVTFGRTIKSTTDLTGSSHMLDGVKTEINTQATVGPSSWDPPRDIKLNLLPERRNLIANPQGLASAFGWVNSGLGIFASLHGGGAPPVGYPVSEVTCGFHMVAGSSFSVEPPAYGVRPYGGAPVTGANAGVQTQVPVLPNLTYCLSAYMLKVLGDGQAGLTVEFLDVTGQPIVLSYTNAATPQAIYTYSYAFPVRQTTAATPGPQWVRGALVNAVAPPNAITAICSIFLVKPTPGDEWYMCAPMMEPVGHAAPYFDGNFNPSSDYFFEGTPNESISDYYPNFLQQVGRLITVMPDYIPMGSTFSIEASSVAIVNIEDFWGTAHWGESFWGG
jgi:hypothetical protein